MKDVFGNGTKETWRGWQWNRVCDRIPKCERRDAVVLYLPGPEDRDRSSLINKGFSNHNLIAVDKSPQAVEGVRRGGGVAICENISDVVKAWPPSRRLDCISADLLGGFTDSSFKLWLAMILRGRPVVCAMNMMRGRDALGGAVSKSKYQSRYTLPPTHRGAQLIEFAIRYLCFEYESAELTPRQYQVWKAKQEQMSNRLSPVFYSYRSQRGMYYDSVICQSFLPPCDDSILAFDVPERTRRRVAAALAVSTQYRNRRRRAKRELA